MNIRRVAIWNPASGSAPDESALKEALGSETELIPTTEDDPGPGQARLAVEQKADLLIACGGDGTVRACLEPLIASSTSLGIVPLGTGNLLASNLGIESGLDSAAGLGAGEPRRIDLGKVNGEVFAVMAGSGFDALMIRDADDAVKSRFGSIAYVFSGLKHLRESAVATKVVVDGAPVFDGKSTMVLVGNFGTITGGLEVFPAASPHDGSLDVAIVSASTWREWISLAGSLLRRKPPRLDLARRAQGRTITVIHDRPQDYELDGEAREPSDRLDFEIIPDAISIHQEGSS